MSNKLPALILLAASAACGSAIAQVTVGEPWIRGTVASQRSTGAFMTLKSAQDAHLVGVASPIAQAVEIHEMRMDGDVMRMRPIPRLALPANTSVELKPGGYHIMLIDLKQPLAAGQRVPLVLSVEGRDRSIQRIEVQAQVRELSATPQHSH